MTRPTLHISDELALPLEAATETFGILAKKGAGKSNAAVVMAEEMFDAGIPWVAIDPKGDWWGLRSSRDGKKPGLPIVVLGGLHGDIPLEATAGKLVADLILDQRLTCVLDVSEFTTAEAGRFLLAFADRLYRGAKQEPLHLFLEEAHEYLPQMVRGEQAALVGAWQRIVKQGRFKGLGVTLVSQRSAALNKDVLTQVDTLIVLQTTSPQDRGAVKAWIDVHSDHREALDSLPSLDKGEAWVWSPSFLPTPLQRIRFRRRRTFDSGATPKVGEVRKPPSTLADVNLDVLRVQMADTVEKAKANDPTELRRELARLRKELASRPAERVEVEVPIEVPVLMPEQVQALEAAVQDLRAAATSIAEAITASVPRVAQSREAPRSRPAQPTRAAPPRASVVADPDAAPLRKGERRMLEVLARHRDLRITRAQLGTLAKLTAKAGTFTTYLGVLKRHGYAIESNGVLTITDAGMAEAGAEQHDPPLTTEEVLDRWRTALRAGERRMLDCLVDAYPKGMTREELADATSLTVSAGTFTTYLGVLRRNGLVVTENGDVAASPTLFIGAS